MRIILPQDRETPVQEVLSDKFKYRFAYSRSADTKQHHDIGQDYLLLQVDIDNFVFALCDGVSQSFYGDLAARLLADSLVDWFSGYLSSLADSNELGKELESHLQELTKKAEPIIGNHPIPQNASPLLKTVLEEKRDLGSETTFICGCIQLPNQSFPEGRVIFAWMGDSRLRLWNQAGDITNKLGNTFQTMQRWSTKRGMVGSKVHLYQSSLTESDQLIRIAAYSDGLVSFDEIGDIVSNTKITELIRQADEGATSDDISFIEIIIDLEGAYATSPWLEDKDQNKKPPIRIEPRIVEPANIEPINKETATESDMVNILEATPAGTNQTKKKKLSLSNLRIRLLPKHEVKEKAKEIEPTDNFLKRWGKRRKGQ